jgi:tetratricopeptide (TPR) repeat protein
MKFYILLAMIAICCGCTHEHRPAAAALLRSADSAWRRGDFSSAALLYEQAGSVAPDAAEPLYDLALTYYRTQNYEMTARYLDRAQPSTTGAMRARCLLLRGDAEYRLAMAAQPIPRVEGLERALHIYRDALAAVAPSGSLNDIARYDIEVVKLKLPAARSQAPQAQASAAAADDTSAADKASPQPETSGSNQEKKPQSQDRDW